jgi:hypothetical protein
LLSWDNTFHSLIGDAYAATEHQAAQAVTGRQAIRDGVCDVEAVREVQLEQRGVQGPDFTPREHRQPLLG